MDRPRLVHRLDRDTSGVLLLGRTPGAAAKLAGAFAKRRAEKTYWAIVVGNPKPAAGWIDMPLIKSGLNDRERVTPAEYNTPGADPAETEYVTLGRAAHRAAFMALRPHTGRTHQLRAHMLAIGHPILGDPKYGDEASDQISEGLKLQLHARCISLPHPSAGRLVIEAPGLYCAPGDHVSNLAGPCRINGTCGDTPMARAGAPVSRAWTVRFSQPVAAP